MKGFQFSSLFETIVVLVLMAIANVHVFPEWPGFISIHPHPFFAIIILISLRYSRLESIVSTALVCAALWLLATVVPEHSESIIKTQVIDKMVLFFITNLVLGEFGALMNRENRQIRRKMESLSAEHIALKARYNALAAVKEELSERIVGQTSSVVSLYEASKSLDAVELEDIQQALLELAVKFVGATKVSLYWRDANEKKLTLIKTLGWSDEENASHKGKSIEFGEGVVGLTAQRGRMYSLNQLSKLDDYEQLKEASFMPSILVAPLNVGGHVVGVINVEELPFLKFTPTAVRLFYLIIDLGSSAIAKSRRFSALEELSVIEPDSGLHAPAYFDRRLHNELQRFSRAGAPFVYLLIRIDDYQKLLKRIGKGMSRFQRELTGLIFSMKRDLDIISAGSKDGTFRMLLPATEIQGAVSFIEKLRKSIFKRLKIRTRDETIRVSASFIAGEVAESSGADDSFAAVIQTMEDSIGKAPNGAVLIGGVNLMEGRQ